MRAMVVMALRYYQSEGFVVRMVREMRIFV